MRNTILGFLLCLLVLKVMDGDTFQLSNGIKVRIYGIDAPERKQPLGLDSTAHLEEEILGKKVTLECKDTSYDRVVCKVFRKGKDVGAAMVRDGYAFAEEYFSSGVYSSLEQSARNDKRGIFGILPGGGEHPHEYRARMKQGGPASANP